MSAAAPRERGIIFTGASVRAILAGTKTQTRRVLKLQPYPAAENFALSSMPGLHRHGDMVWPLGPGHDIVSNKPGPHPDWVARHVKFAAGDRLWVREAWAHDAPDNDTCRRGIESDGLSYGPYYKATASGFDVSSLRWRSPIHMPRWASRLTLTVTDVRVQRLQDISEADAVADGVEPPETERDAHDWSICPDCGGTGLHGALAENLGYVEVDCSSCRTHRDRYRHLWNSIHGPNAWDLNPWVAAITFAIDAAPPAPVRSADGGAP